VKIPEYPPNLSQLIRADTGDAALREQFKRVFNLLPSEHGKDRDGHYLHWERLKRQPLPQGVDTHEDWWLLTKFRRTSLYKPLPLRAKAHTPFVYWLPDCVQQRLHKLDQQASGRVEIPEQVTNKQSRDRYLVNSLIEEAIKSSQLEGASTTYPVAKNMLREGRAPRDRSEQMISNNYRAMAFIREHAGEPLTPALVFELHAIVTERSLEDRAQEGRFRRADEEIGVYDPRDHSLLHAPPPADELDARLGALCAFANAGLDDDGEFLHPVVRAIALHFMVGYDHPFVDGNGRAARALFYWAMARHKYWLMEYVSISTILKRAPAQYARAYLYTEHDDNDLTYFIDYNLRVVEQAIKALQGYLAKKSREVRRIEALLGDSLFARTLNHRQIALLSHAIRNPGDVYTFESHRQSHRISYPTARTDLLELATLRLLEQRKVRNAFVFLALPDIEGRLLTLRGGNGFPRT